MKNKIKELDGTGWSRSLDTSDKDEGERFVEAAPLALGSGKVE